MDRGAAAIPPLQVATMRTIESNRIKSERSDIVSSGKRGVFATRRTIRIVVLCAVAMSLAHAQSAPPLSADPPISCTDCDAWNAPQEPFRVFGNTYYVGVRGLSAVLIDAGGSLILLDAALPQSAPLI